jgi:glutamyl-tRNA reductase
LKQQLQKGSDKLIIDLSIPYNVEETAGTLPNVTLVNVDELAKLKDETLAKRLAEVPKAKAIIRESIAEILNWYEMRKHVPVLTAVKLKLKEIHSQPIHGNETITTTSVPCKKTEARIQKILNGMACKMRSQNQRGCNYIEAINEFLAPPSHN